MRGEGRGLSRIYGIPPLSFQRAERWRKLIDETSRRRRGSGAGASRTHDSRYHDDKHNFICLLCIHCFRESRAGMKARSSIYHAAVFIDVHDRRVFTISGQQLRLVQFGNIGFPPFDSM